MSNDEARRYLDEARERAEQGDVEGALERQWQAVRALIPAEPEPEQPREHLRDVGKRVTDGGMLGTLVVCRTCNGDGVLHDPDERPAPVSPTPEPEQPQAALDGEPGVGAVVRDHTSKPWRRESDGWHPGHACAGNHCTGLRWPDFREEFGPLTLVTPAPTQPDPTAAAPQPNAVEALARVLANTCPDGPQDDWFMYRVQAADILAAIAAGQVPDVRVVGEGEAGRQAALSFDCGGLDVVPEACDAVIEKAEGTKQCILDQIMRQDDCDKCPPGFLAVTTDLIKAATALRILARAALDGATP